jgi:hypothetical protein
MIPIVIVSQSMEIPPAVDDFIMKSGQPFLHYVRPQVKYFEEYYKNKDHNIANARTAAMHQVLKTYLGAQYLFFLDADVVPPPNAIETLLAKKKRIISGWVPRRGGGWVGGQWVLPHVFQHYKEPGPGLTETHIVNLGATLVHRPLLENYIFGPGDEYCRRLEDGMVCRLADSGQFSQEMIFYNKQTLYLDGDVICQHLD